jgi:hypothetical protein
VGADSRAVAANRKIEITRNVSANSASARSRVAAASKAQTSVCPVSNSSAVAFLKCASNNSRSAHWTSFSASAWSSGSVPLPQPFAEPTEGQAKLLSYGNRNYGRRMLPATRRGGSHQRDGARFAFISQNAQAILWQRS